MVSSLLWVLITTVVAVKAAAVNVVYPNNPLVWHYGRWDFAGGSWWAGSGIALHVENLNALSLQLGPNTTAPTLNVGLSINYGAFTTIALKNGTNVIPLTSNSTVVATHGPSSSVIRLKVEGVGENMYLQKIILNAGARLLPYTPSKLSFQFIGDSLSSGYLLPNGVVGAWPIITSEAFKAEPTVNAQPGACLTDRECWGNPHGIQWLYNKTEDSGYYYNPNHNYTTPWDLRKNYRPTHIFFQAGTNDNSFNVPADELAAAYHSFIAELRHLYPTQPIFVLGTWGYPNEDGTYGYIYEGVFENVVAEINAAGDKRVYFINTRGWIAFDDVYEDRTHPNPQGSAKIAANLQAWLKNWGLQPQKKWPTSIN